MFDEYSTICLTVSRSVPRVCALVDHAVGDLDRGSEPERRAGVDDLLLQRSRDGHELEGGARLVRVGDGPVAATVGARRREAVGVEARRRRHREHLTGARIHDDSRRRLARPSGEPCPGASPPHSPGSRGRSSRRTLRPGRLGLGLDDVERAPERVLDDRLAPGLAGERALERALESLEALVVEPRVAEHLRRDRALRVVAKLLGIEAEPGEVRAPRGSSPFAGRPSARRRRSRASGRRASGRGQQDRCRAASRPPASDPVRRRPDADWHRRWSRASRSRGARRSGRRSCRAMPAR